MLNGSVVTQAFGMKEPIVVIDVAGEATSHDQPFSQTILPNHVAFRRAALFGANQLSIDFI